MGNIYLEVSAVPGRRLDNICVEGVDLARRTGVSVRIAFNGGVIFAHPDSDPSELYLRFNEENMS